ncbi:tripartite tricarboxylate transporter TctB family protein, partial [Micrococcus sp. SIMBA_144]
MIQASAGSPAADAPARWGRAAGLSALGMPAVLAAFSLYLLLGSLAMDTERADFPGPDFFSLILAVAGLVIAAALAVE